VGVVVALRTVWQDIASAVRTESATTVGTFAASKAGAAFLDRSAQLTLPPRIHDLTPAAVKRPCAIAGFDCVPVKGDGHCGARALSVGVFGDERHYLFIKMLALRNALMSPTWRELELSVLARIARVDVPSADDWWDESALTLAADGIKAPIIVHANNQAYVRDRLYAPMSSATTSTIHMLWDGANHYGGMAKAAGQEPHFVLEQPSLHVLARFLAYREPMELERGVLATQLLSDYCLELPGASSAATLADLVDSFGLGVPSGSVSKRLEINFDAESELLQNMPGVKIGEEDLTKPDSSGKEDTNPQPAPAVQAADADGYLRIAGSAVSYRLAKHVRREAKCAGQDCKRVLPLPKQQNRFCWTRYAYTPDLPCCEACARKIDPRAVDAFITHMNGF
jgi:hypothetical protein